MNPLLQAIMQYVQMQQMPQSQNAMLTQQNPWGGAVMGQVGSGQGGPMGAAIGQLLQGWGGNNNIQGMQMFNPMHNAIAQAGGDPTDPAMQQMYQQHNQGGQAQNMMKLLSPQQAQNWQQHVQSGMSQQPGGQSLQSIGNATGK